MEHLVCTYQTALIQHYHADLGTATQASTDLTNKVQHLTDLNTDITTKLAAAETQLEESRATCAAHATSLACHAKANKAQNHILDTYRRQQLVHQAQIGSLQSQLQESRMQVQQVKNNYQQLTSALVAVNQSAVASEPSPIQVSTPSYMADTGMSASGSTSAMPLDPLSQAPPLDSPSNPSMTPSLQDEATDLHDPHSGTSLSDPLADALSTFTAAQQIQLRHMFGEAGSQKDVASLTSSASFD